MKTRRPYPLRRVSDPMERFEKNVARCPMSGCWIWLGRTMHQGYGMFFMDRQDIRAHRAAWKLFRGPLLDGVSVLHRCDNPPCVNPAHLFLGTQTDNMLDMDAKGRRPSGARHVNAKLTAEQVEEMRAAYAVGETLRQLAFRYGINFSTVSKIVSGYKYRAAPGPITISSKGERNCRPPAKCSVANCSKDAHGRGWCDKHYRRWMLHGDPLGGGKERRDRGLQLQLEAHRG